MFQFTKFKDHIKILEEEFNAQLLEEVVCDCDSEAALAREQYQRHPAKDVWTLQFEESHPSLLCYRNQMENLMIKIYFKYGIYRFKRGFSVDDLQEIPTNILGLDANFHRIRYELDRLTREALTETDTAQMAAYLEAYETKVRSLCLGIARASYYLYQSWQDGMEPWAAIFEAAMEQSEQKV